MIKLIVIGNLGNDPEMRYTPSGQAVTTFSVASNYKTKAGQETTWLNASCFGKLADLANDHLEKGKQVYLEGQLRTRRYEGQNGPGCSHDIMVDRIQFLGKAGGRDENPADEAEESDD